MLTHERAQVLASYLDADIARARQLVTLTPTSAMNQINADGYDFTTEELEEFGKQLQSAAVRTGELDETELGEVAGGLVIEGVAISCIALGYKIGSDLAKNYGW